MDLGEVIKTAVALIPLALFVFAVMFIQAHLEVIGYALVALAAILVCVIVIRRGSRKRRKAERDAIDELLDETD